MAQVKAGDHVSIYYTGKLPDGTVFDNSEEGEPLDFDAGGEELISGVSMAVIGMNIGDKKSIEVSPEEGYGDHNPDLQQEVPRSDLPPDVKVGDQLVAEGEGQEISVWIRELNDKNGVVDANHPLAGETLLFDIELVAIEGQ